MVELYLLILFGGLVNWLLIGGDLLMFGDKYVIVWGVGLLIMWCFLNMVVSCVWFVQVCVDDMFVCV